MNNARAVKYRIELPHVSPIGVLRRTRQATRKHGLRKSFFLERSVAANTPRAKSSARAPRLIGRIDLAPFSGGEGGGPEKPRPRP